MKTPRVSLALTALLFSACSITPESLSGLSSFHIEITSVNGKAPPTATAPLPPTRGNGNDAWAFSIEARDALGDPAPFDGLVRLSVHPGAVISVESPGSVGRNVLLTGGKASGVVHLSAIYGPTNLWVEDVGYVPAPIGQTAACANGKDDNHNGLIDFPSDPGCEYADDNTEDGGTFTAGISPPVQYALPTLSDVQGEASTTPYPNDAISVNASPPEALVVTRVANDGFYVTDVTQAALGYNHIFAFNFSTPPGIRVCDRVTSLAGTANDFFGFTELSFPSWTNTYVYTAADCIVPEPTVLTPDVIGTDSEMEKHESGLVRIQGYTIASKFGPGLVMNNVATMNASNCDLNGDGAVDFSDPTEASCATVCDADPECSEYTTYSARGEYKVHLAATMIQINTQTVPQFDPLGHRNETIDVVSGTLRDFSGGTLNWTIEARCSDDLVCKSTGCGTAVTISSTVACVSLRNADDNDEGTN